eukprot:6174340-Pleurochrysis_carterae.AAC.3
MTARAQRYTPRRVHAPPSSLNQPFASIVYICADKKGVEALRGCTACCPWFTCDDTLRLTYPWLVARPPSSWAEAAALLSRSYKHPFPSIPLIHKAAHEPLQGQQLPQTYRFCHKLPFASVEEL